LHHYRRSAVLMASRLDRGATFARYVAIQVSV